MLVQIQDHAALSSLSIVSLRVYLNSREWNDEGPWGKRPARIYVKEHDGRSWEILVPTKDTLADYAESMAESIAILAAVEERSQLEVFDDLSATGADVIRVRSVNGMAKEPLSLRQSATLLNDAYSMVASAARAVEKPQAAYRGPVSTDVAEYLDNVRPLPGHHQGYDLTLHSPVPAGFQTQTDMGDDFYAPFPRRATLKLAEALEYSSEAIFGIVVDDPLERFRQAVPHGVSANLCDAVANLAKKGEGIEIDFFWAPVRSSTSGAHRFQFSEHAADILNEAARSFRRDEPLLNESVVAQVVALAREPEEFDGRATIFYVQDGHPIRMHVKFDESSYTAVIRAFENRYPLSVDGDIYRVGGGYELRNPRNLSLLSEE